jgi:predicted Rossmann fold flavoprotein
MYNTRLASVARSKGEFELRMENGHLVTAKRVILATGGSSYKATGSSGDGFRIAESLGHKLIPLAPGLVPLKVKEAWVKGLQGIALENVRITFEYGRKKAVSGVGELMFTHFGVSGPLVLDMSAEIVSALGDYKEIKLFIDLKPGLKPTQLEGRLLNEFAAKGKTQLKTVMKSYLPQRLIKTFLELSGAHDEKAASQITQKERRAIIGTFKAMPLTVTGALPLEEAMVTLGGVSTKEIDPRTMGSRIVPGLYFAGEVINGSAPSGGYNLQQAFSTGYLAGQKAAESLG